MVILITGASGFLGSRIVKKINSLPDYKCFCLGFNNIPKINGIQANLSDKKKVFQVFNQVNPDLIIHAAAMTDVDQCEKDLLNAYRLNVQATKNIVEWVSIQEKSIRFVYISTDQVYNNLQLYSSATEEEVNPINFYGMSKLWAEDIVSSLNNYLILRTNFFSFEGGLIKWLFDSNSSSQKINLFENIWFNPIYIPDFTDALLRTLKSDKVGVFNLGARDSGITKADFLEMIIIKFNLSDISSVRSKFDNNIFLTAKRPLNMMMSINKFENSFSHNLPSIEESVDRMIYEFKNLK